MGQKVLEYFVGRDSELKPRVVEFSTSQALVTFIFLTLFFTLLNGYVLNLVGGYQANAWVVLVALLFEMAGILVFAPRWISIAWNSVELAGSLVTFFGIWVYFVSAALPTLLPPTQSVDAVRHYQQAMFSYERGTLVSWYPAANAFLVAMFSRWLGTTSLTLLHPMVSAFVALAATTVYGVTCQLLPRRPLFRVAALVAPALLFIPWSYFAGIIDWEQYYAAQVLAQFFVLAALWYTTSYAQQSHWVLLALFGGALLSTVAAYPYLVALPLAVFVLILLARLARGGIWARQNRPVLVAFGLFLLLLLLAALALQQGGILELKTFRIGTEQGVGEGGVTNPSLENLGGPLYLLLALVGVGIAWRAGSAGRTLVVFVCAWLLQLGALFAFQSILPISGYRIDKTFYILVFPLAILAALAPAHLIGHWEQRVALGRARLAAAFALVLFVLGAGIVLGRPPRPYSPLESSELETAFWVKAHLNTYEVNVLDAQTTRAYWLAFGLWGETLPNEWFQWIPAGTKLGPKTYSEWLNDSSWGNFLFVRDMNQLPGTPANVVHREGPSAILMRQIPTFSPPTPSQVSHWEFEPALELLGYDLARTTFTPGETLRLTTYAESLAPPSATVVWRVELIDRAGNAVSHASRDPFSGKYPLQRWAPGRYSRDDWELPLDSNIAPGVYDLRLGLYHKGDGEAVIAVPLSSEFEWRPYSAVPLAKIKIPVAPPSPEEIRAATPVNVQVGEAFVLSGYVLKADRAAHTIGLALYWSGLNRTGADYTIFVHLLDGSGNVISQKDAPPLDGAYPTSMWEKNEIVKTEYNFALASGTLFPAAIEIGMYSQPELRRLPIGETDHIMLNLNN